jgi:transposase
MRNTMLKQKRFTKEFEAEAVRLVETSGRTRAVRSRRISALGFRRGSRWIGRSRDRQIDHPPKDRQEDMAAELKRLKRENEILLPRSGTF